MKSQRYLLTLWLAAALLPVAQALEQANIAAD
jgi:hypothetical protein